MEASRSLATPAAGPALFDWPEPVIGRGVATRLAAAALHAVAGLLIGTSAFGLAVAARVADRGLVAFSPADTALLDAILPAVAIFGVIALAHLVAAVGVVLGTQTGAALGIVAGLADVVAGAVIMVIALFGSRNRDDGLGIGATFVAAGLLLAAAALVADRRTHPAARGR